MPSKARLDCEWPWKPEAHQSYPEAPYYRTQRVHADSRTTKDEATPLLIVDGELVGWGEAALEHARVR